MEGKEVREQRRGVIAKKKIDREPETKGTAKERVCVNKPSGRASSW